MRVLGLLFLVAAAPVAEQRYLQYERPVMRDANAGGQSCVALDPTVFAHAAPGLGDLRLYRDAEKQSREETPYALRRMEAVQPAMAAETLLNRGTREGRVVFDVAMPEGRYKDLDLAVEKRDFLATVMVTGRERQGEAGTKLGDYTIYDFSSQGLGRSTVLHLPDSDFRYLHFSVAGPVEARDFTNVAVVRRPVAALYLPVAQTATAVQQGQDTVLTFMVAEGIPVDRVVIEPGAKPVEFKRDVTAMMAAGKSKSGAVGQFWRMHRTVKGTAIEEQNLTLLLGRIADDGVARKVTVAIHNGNDAPLAIHAARLEMVERDLCFDAQPGAEYALFYGDAALESPQYDYARLFTAESHALPARLGAEARNARYEPRPDGRPLTERHRWLLWLALMLVLALLALVALRTAKTLPAGTE